MYSIIVLAFSSLLIALILTPICRELFLRWNLVDVPDQRRRLHTRPIPRLGGIPVALAFVASYLLLLAIPLHGGEIVSRGMGTITRLLPAVVLVFAVGLIDDLITLNPWAKLIGQIAASATAWALGVRVTMLHGFRFNDAASLAVTMLWLLACTNAFNLIDGIDGLAAGIGLVATLTTLIAALFQKNTGLVFATIPLAGALLGFLRYNFNPATIFLGDCGSLLIGFLLGCYGVIWGQKSATLIGVTAPLMALAVPLLEVGLSIVRRFLRGQPIFGADRGHIHHRLLDRGLTPRRVVLLLYACTGLFAALSLLATMYHASYGGIAVVLFCGVAWFGIQNLNYAEFGTAGRLIVGGIAPANSELASYAPGSRRDPEGSAYAGRNLGRPTGLCFAARIHPSHFPVLRPRAFGIAPSGRRAGLGNSDPVSRWRRDFTARAVCLRAGDHSPVYAGSGSDPQNRTGRQGGRTCCRA